MQLSLAPGPSRSPLCHWTEFGASARLVSDADAALGEIERWPRVVAGPPRRLATTGPTTIATTSARNQTDRSALLQTRARRRVGDAACTVRLTRPTLPEVVDCAA